MYEFVETRRGRELIFQNYSYTRFCQSNVYNCTNKTAQLCYAQIMLDDNKILITSPYHNHLPPFLLRDENGTTVASFTERAEPKPKRKGKPTLGPRATRSQVNSLVASIMNSVKAMENKSEVATPNVSKVTTDADVAASLSKEATPKMVVKRTKVPKTKKKITPENNQTRSAVTGSKKNGPFEKQISSSHVNSLLKVASLNKSEFPQETNTTDISQITPSLESVVPREIGNVPLLKQDAGSLVPNKMYIVVPNVESSMQHNRIILSPPNVSGLVYSNRILVSPIQTDPSTNNNIKIQPMSLRNLSTIDDTVSKKIDTNSVVPNKMFFLVQTNNMNPMTPKINENTSFVSTKIEPATPNEAGALAPNKMLILVKSENDSLVSSDTQPKLHEKESEPNYKLSMPQKEIKAANVSSTMPKLQPKRLEMKTSIPMASIKNVIFPHQKIEGIVSPININDTPLKTNDNWADGSSLMSKKTETNQAIFSSAQPILINKTETIAFEANDMSVPPMTKIDDMFRNINTTLPKTSKKICSLDIRCTSEAQTLNVVPEKMLKTDPKKNEIDSSVHRKTQQILLENTGTAESNKMQTFVLKIKNDSDKLYDSEPLVQLKAESFSAAIDNIIPKETDNIANDNQITNLDRIVPVKIKSEHDLSSNKERKTQNKTEALNPVSTVYTTLHSTVQPQNQIKNVNVRSNLTKQKTMTFMESYINTLEKNSKTSATVEANTSKKSASENIQTLPTKKNEADNVNSKENLIKSKITMIADENGNKQSMPEKIEDKDFFAGTSSNIDFDWIVPKNKKIAQPKKETDVPSNNNTKDTDNTSLITSDIPEIPISVSMIPLPKENNSSQTGIISVASEATFAFKEVQPVVMIERLPMKHKAGSSNMRSVPLKKRYYQF